MSEKKIILIDSSGIKELICPLRYYRTVVQGYKPKQTNISMAFGLAFHVFRKAFRTNASSFGTAIGEAVEYFKSLNIAPPGKKAYLNIPYLINACQLYAIKYEKDNVKPVILNDKPLLELQFPLPYRITDTYEVLLVGTIDEIAKISNGIYCIVDCKTSAQGEYAIKAYLDSYAISRQLMFYRLLVSNFHKLHPGTIFDEIASSQIGAMIDGVFTQGKDNIEFGRSDVFLFKDELYNEFLTILDKFIDKAIALAFAESRPNREGLMTDACTLYGGCTYFNSCLACDETVMNYILERNFNVKPFNPLKHND